MNAGVFFQAQSISNGQNGELSTKKKKKNHFYHTLVQIVHRVENTLDTNLVAVSPSFQTCKKQNLPRLYHCYVCTIVNQIRQVIVNLPRNMAHC
jgi:hypothetical protein